MESAYESNDVSVLTQVKMKVFRPLFVFIDFVHFFVSLAYGKCEMGYQGNLILA